MDFTDVHLSTFARNLLYGFYGVLDTAVVEVSRIRPDGSVILSSSVGISVEALSMAKKIILEVNTAIPDYTGFHDIVLPAVHPKVGWPIPIINVDDRVGTPYVRHIDHTEHDIKCLCTEQGYAVNTEIRSARRRAEDIIEQCAHPYFKPLLREYQRIAGGGNEPRATDMNVLQGWWKEYDEACRCFPAAVEIPA